MCGNAGILNLDGRGRIAPASIWAMCEAIVHRGTDGHGEYLDGPHGMLMRDHPERKQQNNEVLFALFIFQKWASGKVRQ